MQTVLPDNQIPQGTSLILFARGLGTAVAGPIAQAVLQKELIKHLGKKAAQSAYGNAGATNIRSNLEKIFGKGTAAYHRALQGINDSVTQVFMVALIMACITALVIPLIEWKSVKTQKREEEDRKEGKTKKPEEKKESA